jgi:hypothetical protein
MPEMFLGESEFFLALVVISKLLMPYLGNIRGEGRFRKLIEKLKPEWEQFEE